MLCVNLLFVVYCSLLLLLLLFIFHTRVCVLLSRMSRGECRWLWGLEKGVISPLHGQLSELIYVKPGAK